MHRHKRKKIYPCAATIFYHITYIKHTENVLWQSSRFTEDGFKMIFYHLVKEEKQRYGRREGQEEERKKHTSYMCGLK